MAISDNIVSMFWHLVMPCGEKKAESFACLSICVMLFVPIPNFKFRGTVVFKISLTQNKCYSDKYISK